jgi:Matrixin
MSVTTASLTTVERNVARVARLTLTLLGVLLVAVLLGQGAPAQAAGTPAPTSTSTQNVGPQLGWAQDTVYVESSATSRWPVKTATERLSKGSPLKLVFVTACPARSAAQPAVQCISVSSGDLGGGTLAGTTHWTFAKSTNKLTSVTTVLNDRWAKTASYNDRLNIAEHELGHGVGLDHVKRTSSIMNAVAHGKTKPDSGDLRALNSLY